MTFLELVKRARQECGIAGDGPITTANQSREMKRLVDWTAQAWVDIQNERSDWDFLYRDFSFRTVAGQQVYEAGNGLDINVSDMKKWRNDSFSIYLETAGPGSEMHLTHILPYSAFKDYYMFGAQRLTRGMPHCISVAPDRKLALGPNPENVYVVEGEYYRRAQVLAADGDVPICDEDYHMLIVYGAMKKYGYFEVANEQVAAAKAERDALYNRFINEYTPMIEMGGSLI